MFVILKTDYYEISENGHTTIGETVEVCGIAISLEEAKTFISSMQQSVEIVERNYQEYPRYWYTEAEFIA